MFSDSLWCAEVVLLQYARGCSCNLSFLRKFFHGDCGRPHPAHLQATQMVGKFLLSYTLPVSRQRVTAIEIAILPRRRPGYHPWNSTYNFAYDRDVKLCFYKISGPGIEERWRWDFPLVPKPGLALTTHPYLAPSLKKDYSYNSHPALDLHGLLWDELYLLPF